jgi:heme exporter protein D
MNSLTGYLAMGGYALYIWPAYGVAAIAMIWLTLTYIARLRRNERDAAALVARNPRHAATRGIASIAEGAYDP